MQYISLCVKTLILIFLQQQCIAVYDTKSNNKKIFKDSEIFAEVNNFCKGNNRNFCSKEHLNLALNFVKQNQLQKEYQLKLDQKMVQNGEKENLSIKEKTKILQELEQKVKVERLKEDERKRIEADRNIKMKKKIFREFQELFSRTL